MNYNLLFGLIAISVLSIAYYMSFVTIKSLRELKTSKKDVNVNMVIPRSDYDFLIGSTKKYEALLLKTEKFQNEYTTLLENHQKLLKEFNERLEIEHKYLNKETEFYKKFIIFSRRQELIFQKLIERFPEKDILEVYDEVDKIEINLDDLEKEFEVEEEKREKKGST